MAETPDSTRASTPQDDFDYALSEANIITDIMAQLADAAIGTTARPCATLFDWLIDQLKDRLESIEVADSTMRRTRA